MDIALGLAAGQKGRTGDNPAVGCVLTKNGRVIGRGATADGGRPHAEIMALKDCADKGNFAQGATAFVTLEPCSHKGRSGPCLDALLGAQISRCVIAAIDPNPKVNWQSAARLQEAGVDTVVGVGAVQAQAIMADFFARFTGHA